MNSSLYVTKVRCDRNDQLMRVWRRFGEGLPVPTSDQLTMEVPHGIPAGEWDGFVECIREMNPDPKEYEGFHWVRCATKEELNDE